MQQQNRNRRPNPAQYDMYATFRTKERAEAAEKRRNQRSVYDVPQKETRTRKSGNGPRVQPGYGPASGAQSGTRGGGDVYRIRRYTPEGAHSAEQPPRPRQAGTVPTPTPPTGRRVDRPTSPESRPPRTAGQQAAKTGTAPRENPHPAGVRVQNTGEEAFQYGFHSSYRTSDGRIIDGFDKKGRPIYREDGASGAVVLHEGAMPVPGRRLHPVRRIRVETLADTDTKPFPVATVLLVFLCTCMVMGVLFTYMRLNEYTNQISTLNYRVSVLRAQANTLSAEVVRREDLISIEQTAAQTLGMVKNDVLTKKYVSIENEDKTEVVSKKEEREDVRVSVEIDLDTGKPIADTESVTEEAAAP